MLRDDRGDGKPDISADARSWCDPRFRDDDGGRRLDLEASGVLLRLPMIWLAISRDLMRVVFWNKEGQRKVSEWDFLFSNVFPLFKSVSLYARPGWKINTKREELLQNTCSTC